MAACGFGASGIKMKKSDFDCLRPKLRTLQPLQGLRTASVVHFDGLMLLQRSKKPIAVCQISASAEDSKSFVEDTSKEDDSTDAVSSIIPTAFELGGFRLYVSRNLAEQSAPPQPPAPTPVIDHAVVEASGSNGSASSTSLALSKPVSLLEKAADEGLVILQSPRVGFFRRSRTIKGKRAPPSCKEKDTVKEGQVLCYIEQLGGEIPIESDISGEVVNILRQDGDPVGYGDALIALLPSFPGIKKLQ